MSLRDLEKYVGAQNEAIGKISILLNSKTTVCTIWNEFKESLWGKPPSTFGGEEKFTRSEKPIRPLHILPDPPPVMRLVARPPLLPQLWNLGDQERILVRTEYDEAVRAAMKSSVNAFVVSGQPGIGLLPSPPTVRRI